MSVTGYFTKNRETRMPRAATHPDPLGIQWGGQVLEGKRSVQDALYQIDWDVRAHLLNNARLRALRGY